MILPTPATLIVFHDAQLRRFGGAPGLRDAGALEAAVGRVESAFGYRTLDVPGAAAMLATAIIKNHPFVDGNKRTGWGALVMVLAGNGATVDQLSDDAVVAAVAQVAIDGDWERLSHLITGAASGLR